MVELTQLQQTLLEQLKISNRYFTIDYNVKAIITIDNGLRLHTRKNNRVVNIDITYNYGKDLYEIKAYSVNGLKAITEQIASYNDVYFDQLHSIIRKILFKEAE